MVLSMRKVGQEAAVSMMRGTDPQGKGGRAPSELVRDKHVFYRVSPAGIGYSEIRQVKLGATHCGRQHSEECGTPACTTSQAISDYMHTIHTATWCLHSVVELLDGDRVLDSTTKTLLHLHYGNQ